MPTNPVPPQFSTVAELAAALKAAPTPELIEFAAGLIAQLASQKGKGAAKSIALSIRNRFSELPENIRERLRQRAKAIVAHSLPDAPVAAAADAADGAVPDWSLRRAAAHLDLHPATLERRLADPRLRRLYGWPWHDGRQWWFRSAALDSRTSAGVMAELPMDEPFHLLPAHCAVDHPPPRWHTPLSADDDR